MILVGAAFEAAVGMREVEGQPSSRRPCTGLYPANVRELAPVVRRDGPEQLPEETGARLPFQCVKLLPQG